MSADEGYDPRVLTIGRCEIVQTTSDTTRAVVLTPTARRIVAALAVSSPEAVTTRDLIERVWGDIPPRTARAVVHNHVSRLRSMLGERALATLQDGYRLDLPCDHHAIADRLTRAESAGAEARPEIAWQEADGALQAFRGLAFEELGGNDAAVSWRHRLDTLQRGLHDIRLSAAIELGNVAWAIAEAQRLIDEDELDEHRWALLADALHRAGRRGDALGAVEQARRTLRDQLGLTPGPELTDVEARILDVQPESFPRGAADHRGHRHESDQCVDAAFDRASVIVMGEPGAGKSAILAEVAARLRRSGLTVARTTCVEHPATPVVALNELLEELRAPVDPVMGVVNGFVGAVARRAAQQPVVLVIDDVHFAGPSTMAALISAARHSAVALLMAADGQLEASLIDPTARLVRLPPLDRTAIAELMTRTTGVAVQPTDDTCIWMAEMSGGNPLFIQLLLDEHRGDSVIDEHGVPAQLADLVRRRLGRLSLEARAALEVAAVIGSASDVALIESILPGSTSLDEAVRLGLVELGCAQSLEFRHGVVREVLYADISPGRRTELHHAIGARLSSRDPVASARHLLASADIDPVGAVTAAIETARWVARHGAHADSAQWWARAVDAVPPGATELRTTRIAARIGQGDALRLAGDPKHEHVLLDAAHEALETTDPELISEAAAALLQLGVTTTSGSPHERALKIADQALSATADPERRALVSAAASLATSMTGRPEMSRTLFDEAEVASRSCLTRRRVLPFAYLALGHPDDLDRRELLGEELYARGREHDDAVARFEALHLRFSSALQRGEGTTMRDALSEMIALVDLVGDVGRRWALLYQQSAVAHLDGDLSRAERLSEEAFALFAPVAPSRALAAHGSQLLGIKMAEGSVEDLAGALTDMLTRQPNVPAWHAALALALVDLDRSRSVHHAEQALDRAHRDFTWLATHVVGGRAAALIGDDDLRRRFLDRLTPYEYLVCWQGTCGYGPVAIVTSRLHRSLGRHQAAQEALAVARRLVASLHAPVFEAELEIA